MKMNVIYHRDCLCGGLQSIPDNSVDMVLTDPPYGTTQNKWDSIVDMNLFWKEIKRVTKENSAILLFSQMPFTAIAVMSNSKMFRYEWICEKHNPTGFLNAKRMPLKSHENVLVFYNKLPTYNPQMVYGNSHHRGGGENRKSTNYGSFSATISSTTNFYYPRDVIKVNWQESTKRLHPTQKPVSLCEYFIKTYSNKGDIIIDPFIGSGTTAVAAVNTGRKYIGFEKEEEYFEIAKSRLEKLANV